MSGSVWLGQHVDEILLSLGDFGSVRANLTYDVFKKKSGYFAYISSCQLLLFTQEIEFLHRLKLDKKERLEWKLASKFKERYESGQ